MESSGKHFRNGVLFLYLRTMIKLNVTDEFSPLKSVVLGTAKSNGATPALKDAYDPKSAEHIKAGTYPLEKDMVSEMEAVATVFEKYGVTVYRPTVIEDYNQIFTRDIAFVIDDKIVISNMLEDRAQEINAIAHVLDQIPQEKIVRLSSYAKIEGGDVMPFGNYILVGTCRVDHFNNYVTARTNADGVSNLQEFFPHKEVKSFALKKSNYDPRENALHLDCCFQPLGQGKCIIHKEGFEFETEYQWLVDQFGEENCFHITKEEMYKMYSNVFSIADGVVISEQKFDRLNDWLRKNNFTVETVPYAEIAKQEGLLRCSTMPLQRA
ncbi:N-dimethylarginine dimethylaminohydrolase [Marinirhabdus gelatinilytica]|uniref:arginine deiminase n=2 Tax=Marinirhabdus gelatinilytica TaxID=1703343 RepID=A0A370QLR8_9FLAO|nr:N-dimethylarginine dimethylaminohydrolase [Marinirhabdus gelatinilytica]